MRWIMRAKVGNHELSTEIATPFDSGVVNIADITL